MTIDEYAAFEMGNRARIVKKDGVWWRRMRPFFYQPLFPFLEIEPGSRKPPCGGLLGGFQHNVPDERMSNSTRHFFVHDNVPLYSIEQLSQRRRRDTKKGSNYFKIRPIETIQEFISAGYPVYRSFFERTHYQYKKERVKKNNFSEWAENLYRFPKLRILGAYHDSELCGIDISYLVEDILFEATSFMKSEHLRNCVGDAMYHAIREQAAGCSGIHLIYKGVVTGNKSLDFSKVIRACKIISKPAYYELNPLAHLLIKNFKKEKYNKLRGSIEPRAEEPKDDFPARSSTPGVAANSLYFSSRRTDNE